MDQRNSDSSADALPYSEDWQGALTGHMAGSAELTASFGPRIEATWFINPHDSRIVSAVLAFRRDFGRHPSLAEILDHPSLLPLPMEDRRAVAARLTRGRELTESYGHDVLRGGVTKWLQVRALLLGIQQGTDHYNARRVGDAHGVLAKALREWDDVGAAAQVETHWGNFLNRQANVALDYRDACTYGLSIMDRLLNNKCQSGCLLPGDATVMLAPTNVGKTRVMWTIAYANALKGYPVLVVPHEGRADDLEEQLVGAAWYMSTVEVSSFLRTPEGVAAYGRWQSWFERNLVFAPLIRRGLTIDELDGHVRARMDRHQARYGVQFKLLVDDFAARLTCAGAKSGKLQRREKDAEIYGDFSLLCNVLKLHGLTCIQTNREGSRVNRGQKEDRLLTMEDVMESFETFTHVANVISLNRSPRMQQLKLLIHYILKSRSGETNIAICGRSDYGKNRTHGDDLGSCFYRGDATNTEALAAVMEKYRDREVPSNLLANA